ncbi:MAG TPA: dihydropteroate synthase, partial [Holophaga sp.]|nr:dihydropteroate synthase [Holophaga sp.]
MFWRTASGDVDLGRPVQLGILNLTPDSFSDGGRFEAPAAALAQAGHLAQAGCGMLDLGAESTRPGADPVSPGTEWERLRAVLPMLRKQLPQVSISVDTRHPRVAERALDCGAAVINDVAGCSDPAMLQLVRTGRCGIIAMRSRMHDGRLFMPDYGTEATSSPDAAIAELEEVKTRLLDAGIAPERILLDPGFGFGTTYAEDLALWRALGELPERLAWPVERFCVAVSRKRFLAWRAGVPGLPPRERDELTRAAHGEAMALG